MYVDDIAELRALKTRGALSVTMERRVIRLGKLFAGELFIHRERARHAAALLQAIAEEYFRELPSLDRDLVSAVSEFEETERCEVAGAAIFVAFAEGRAKDDDRMKTVSNALLDRLSLIHRRATEAVTNASLQLPFEQEAQPAPATCHPNTDPQTTQSMSDTNTTVTSVERLAPITSDTADVPHDRGLALLHAAAVKGRVSICARGAPPFVFEVPNAPAAHSRSYRGTLKVEGHVDGLRWHNLAFSVHGAPLPAADAVNDANSGKRFFSGKVDARIFLKLLPHFVNRSTCVFELHEFARSPWGRAVRNLDADYRAD